MSTLLNRMQARWDVLAAEQLRAEVARLAEENERLAAQLDQAERARECAEHWAESWQEDFHRACEANGTQPGLTIDGHLVSVQPAQRETHSEDIDA